MEFLCQLRSALLLALLERGRLTPMEYRQARERLNRLYRDLAEKKQEEP